MAKETTITQESFDALLHWLDNNREIAGQKYEKIRGRLIRIFAGRGCFEPEDLADETINRVTLKLPQIADGYIGEPILYFLRVADNIHREWLRKQKKVTNLQDHQPDQHEEPESDLEYECLESCLETLETSQREIIVEYYLKEKSAKIEHRKSLAEKLGISPSAFQVRMHRLRARLQDCVQKCVAEKKS